MQDTLIVIPARYASTRLKAKVLEMLEGKSVLQRVYEACVKAKAGAVLIATDSEVIMEHCRAFGAASALTSPDCPSGTDRIYQACKGRAEKYIINVQGDEPFVEPSTISGVANLLKSDATVDIATACSEMLDAAQINNPNCVKAVLTADRRALYFSRAAVPFKREVTDENKNVPYYRHAGIYGYKRAALEKFVSLPPSPLERLERLEQLRALEAGMIIKSIIIKEPGPAIDTKEDLEAAKKYIKK